MKCLKILLALSIATVMLFTVGCSNSQSDDWGGDWGGLGDTITGFVSDIFADTFDEFEDFGLVFNADDSTLHYNGELVTFFEDDRGSGGSTAFGDSNGQGLHVVAVRDSEGNIIGLESTRR